MRVPKRPSILVIAAGLVSSACFTGFRHPLGPADDGFVEEQLRGTWSCASADDPKPARLTIVDFDGRQYYLESVEAGKSDPDRFRGHATRVEGASFLSVRELEGKPDADWTIMQYDLAESGHLTLRMVDPEPFEDVIDDAAAVRERLSTRLQDPEIITGVMTCSRSDKDAPR